MVAKTGSPVCILFGKGVKQRHADPQRPAPAHCKKQKPEVAFFFEFTR